MPHSAATIAAPSRLAPATQRPAAIHEGAPPAPQVAAPNPLADGDEVPPASKEPGSPLTLPLISAPAQGGELSASAPALATTPVGARSLVTPAQIAPPAKPGRPDANIGAPPPLATDGSIADAENAQMPPAAPAKKPASAASEAKPAAAQAKPAPVQSVATGGNTGTIVVATASPDAAIPLPAADAMAQVRTVPLSNLASLPHGAAVTAIGAVIASEAAAGTSRFLIRLDPPELGRIDVRLRFGRDGEVHARLIADRPETASILMRDAAVLERALNAAGMRTDSGVDVMLRDSSSGFARTDGGPGGDTPSASPYREPAVAPDLLSETPAWIRPSLAGRIDLTV
jgi:hypothetical protein